MALVAAKCTECGAAIEVEDTKDAGICSFCGTAFITQKVINQHHTHVTKHITKTVFGIEGKSAEDFCEKAETFIKLDDWEKAKVAYEQATEIDPANYLGWFGLAKWHTRNFSNAHDTAYIIFYNKAIAVASETERNIIDTAIGNFKISQGKHFKRIFIEKTKVANEALPDARKACKKGKLGCILCLTIVLIPLYYMLANKGRPAIKKFVRSVLESNKAERRLMELGVEVPIVEKTWDVVEFNRVEDIWRSSENPRIVDIGDDVNIDKFDEFGKGFWIGFKFLRPIR